MDNIKTTALNDLYRTDLPDIINHLSIAGVVDRSLCTIMHVMHLSDDFVAVLFSLPTHRFYLQFTYEAKETTKLDAVCFHPHKEVYLLITSKKFTYENVVNIVKAKPTKGWSIGDNFRNTSRIMDFTSVKYCADEDINTSVNEDIISIVSRTKLNKEKVDVLKSSADCRVVIAIWSHHSVYTGFIIESDTMETLAKIQLDLDYMPYVFTDSHYH